MVSVPEYFLKLEYPLDSNPLYPEIEDQRRAALGTTNESIYKMNLVLYSILEDFQDSLEICLLLSTALISFIEMHLGKLIKFLGKIFPPHKQPNLITTNPFEAIKELIDFFK